MSLPTLPLALRCAPRMPENPGRPSRPSLRLYGRATATPIQESPLADRLPAGAPGPDKARQVVEIEVDKAQTSCGFGVPIYEFVGERPPEARGRRFRQ